MSLQRRVRSAWCEVDDGRDVEGIRWVTWLGGEILWISDVDFGHHHGSPPWWCPVIQFDG